MNGRNIFGRVKALVGRPNWTEVYAFVLLSVGLPYIGYLVLGWKAAVIVAILVQIGLVFVYLRYRGIK